jgi:hypothetical protein
VRHKVLIGESRLPHTINITRPYLKKITKARRAGSMTQARGRAPAMQSQDLERKPQYFPPQKNKTFKRSYL